MSKQVSVHESNKYQWTGKMPDSGEQKPNSNSTNDEIKAWLDDHDIDYKARAKKAKLLALIP